MSAFETHPKSLDQLLKDCHTGALQLPEFQRSWVWDVDRITSLIASISRGFPVGTLMSLKTGGAVRFKPRAIEGAPVGREVEPASLLLDGQQRMTSLYQVTLRNQVVETVTAKNKPIKRWFYFNMVQALDASVDRESAIVTVPEDKLIRSDFGRQIDVDLSSPDGEYKNLMFPITSIFEPMNWLLGFNKYWENRGLSSEKMATYSAFQAEVINNFQGYQMPEISLSKYTSKEAVCLVFEKVNTGGKALDAFELITAMYAADEYELRKDWYGDPDRGLPGYARIFKEEARSAFAKEGVLAGVGNTDFLHLISLFHTRDLRRAAIDEGKTDKDVPAITGRRQALLELPLESYLKYKDRAEKGFKAAAKFLHSLHIFRTYDLPYQTQIIPLAAILADLGDSWSNATNRHKLVRWYWNGVFGELYSSSTETRTAKDFVEVIDWVNNNGPIPGTILESQFRADRLETMRMRLSAAYKGVNALLMVKHAKDFRTGSPFGQIIFFDEDVDIHHIFPQDWCKKQGIQPAIYDSIINKTPLSARTNRIIGGVAPSEYLAKLEKGSDSDPAVDHEDLNHFLETHLIGVDLLRADNFSGFMEARKQRLVSVIEAAIGSRAVESDSEDDETWGIDAPE
jgi:hypothetical protein